MKVAVAQQPIQMQGAKFMLYTTFIMICEQHCKYTAWLHGPCRCGSATHDLNSCIIQSMSVRTNFVLWKSGTSSPEEVEVHNSEIRVRYFERLLPPPLLLLTPSLYRISIINITPRNVINTTAGCFLGRRQHGTRPLPRSHRAWSSRC